MAQHGELTFTVTFRGPFAVATGTANEGLSLTVDEANSLPASSIKGLMAGQAEHVLGVPLHWCEHVFGSSRIPCPWAWSDADFAVAPTPARSVRIAVDDAGAARGDMLRFGRALWADTATFRIEQIGELVGDIEVHRHILRAAARSVSSLGGERRRGSGWVTISDDLAWTATDTAALLALQSDPAVGERTTP